MLDKEKLLEVLHEKVRFFKERASIKENEIHDIADLRVGEICEYFITEIKRGYFDAK